MDALYGFTIEHDLALAHLRRAMKAAQYAVDHAPDEAMKRQADKAFVRARDALEILEG